MRNAHSLKFLIKLFSKSLRGLGQSPRVFIKQINHRKEIFMGILNGKKIVILGDRDGIPGPAIEACVATVDGAEVVFSTTECFV